MDALRLNGSPVPGRARTFVLRIIVTRSALFGFASARGSLLLGALLTLASNGVWSARAQAFCRLTTEMPTPGVNCAVSGIGLAWQRQCISYSVMPRQSATPPLDQIRDVADVSFHTWQAVTCNGKPLGLSLAQTSELGGCGTPEYNTHAPNANTIIFVTDWAARELPDNAFGLTLVWHNPDTGEIYDADMQLNETLGTITICGQVCPDGGVDLQNVMTHEAGHFLGLGHSNVHSATMSASATVGETSKRVLAVDDKQGICSIYSELGAAMCNPEDYVPNHGFSAQCAPSGQTTTTHKLGCSVGNVGRAGGAFGAWLLAGVLVLCARRQRRAGMSNASPSPTNK